MTPFEVTVKTLAEHEFDWTDQDRECACGWVWEDERDDTAHLAHQAGMLAAAGVVMGVQEWGVDGGGGTVNCGEDEQWARYLAELSEAALLTRFTGATAWTAEEGL